jgi:hypothetical protein
MKGPLAEVVIFPRYTGFVGAGTYISVPVDLSGFDDIALDIWRGALLGDPAEGAGFEMWLEESQDAQQWTEVDLGVTQPIDTPDAIDLYRFSTSRRWFRIRVIVTKDTVSHFVAMNVWASGTATRRTP